MKLFYLTVLTRFRRRKIRLFFLFLAIAASSCLVAWTVGAYQSLFRSAAAEHGDGFGKYQVKFGGVSSARFGALPRGGFGGPFAGSPKDSPNTLNEKMSVAKRPDSAVVPRYDPLRTARDEQGAIVLTRLPENIPSHIRKKLTLGDLDRDGLIRSDEERRLYPKPSERSEGRGGRMGGPGGPNRLMALSPKLIEEVRGDRDVLVCDEMMNVRGFLFSLGQKSGRFVSDEPLPEDSFADRTEELRRRALAAYRSVMGTPMGMGESFIGTTALDSPFEIRDGRWLDPNRPEALEAVLTDKGAKKFGDKLDESIFVLTPNGEYVLRVVGIVEDRSADTFYVSMALAEKIGGGRKTDTLGVALRSGVDRETFRQRMETKADSTPVETAASLARKQKEEAVERDPFRYQAISGSILAVLASIFIIFTALNMDVDERRRILALHRAVGLTRAQIAGAVFCESLFLALFGWLGGLLAGWLILCVGTGKFLALNSAMVGFSFLCALVGSPLAAMIPVVRACRLLPIEAVGQSGATVFSERSRTVQRRWLAAATVLGLALLAADGLLVYYLPMNDTDKAALQSGLGVCALALGTLLLIPALLWLAEQIFTPILATILRFDAVALRGELSSRIVRSGALVATLAVGVGLFVSMQVWGYSMLQPFLPNRNMPDCFVSFLPNGLPEKFHGLVRQIPSIRPEEFLTVTVEQAALADDAVPKGKEGAFANVVFFGLDTDRAFLGPHPMLSVKFRQGDPQTAFELLKNGNGCVITDSISVDYGLRLGDPLRVIDPKDDGRTVELPIVGVVEFPGWQWLSKTGGVRRNFARSGGLVFADTRTIQSEFRPDRQGYFWFNTDGTISDDELQNRLDEAAQTVSAVREKTADKAIAARTYTKLSSRQSLFDSISSRADQVIWGMSVMPLVTLAITSSAVFGAITNSVRSRRRWFGVMRSVGVTRGAIVRLILAEAALVGTTAALAGLLFGFLAAAGALKLGRSLFGTADPALFVPWEGLAWGLGLLFGLCLAAAVIPAVRAGRAEPLTLLQEGRGAE